MEPVGVSKTETRQKELTLNMGPQHPATHGVLRLTLDLNGEVVVRCTPHIGYLHRGVEKLAESRTYQSAMPLTDRLDYVASMANNIGYCLAVEKLFGIDVPNRAQYLRTIVFEMSRICSHLLWLATHALDIGAMTVFLYCFREREWLLDIFETICGARLTVSYPRIGGVFQDMQQEVISSLQEFTQIFPNKIGEYETLIDKNRIWLQRTRGVGIISAQDAVRWGLTGPSLRGSGVSYDLRRDNPYDAYDRVEFEVPVGSNGDVYDRYRCRMEELRQSNRIIQQCLAELPDGDILAHDAPELDMPLSGKKELLPEMSRYNASISFGNQLPIVPKGEVYRAVEAPKGELGFYVMSDGTSNPFRMRIRTPSFVHAGALTKMCEGGFIADVIAIIGSIDIVMGECDR
jgi:NADH dehydrogenase I D subunit